MVARLDGVGGLAGEMSLPKWWKILKRTYATSLTDDELILFDVMFWRDVAFSHLRLENFGGVFNYPDEHSHNYPAEKLWRVLDTLIARGLLHATGRHLPFGDRTYYGLTPAGGRLWELERRPDWMRYVELGFAPTDWDNIENGLSSVELKSVSLETAKACWASEVPTIALSEVIITRRENAELVNWKIVPELFVLKGTGPDPLEGDWETWQARELQRIWWDEVWGLPKFQDF